MKNRELAKKIYNHLNEKGAGLGSVSVMLIESTLDEALAEEREQIINYIENEAEILIPVEELMHKSGRHLTKKEYGIVLIKHLATELREKFLKQN